MNAVVNEKLVNEKDAPAPRKREGRRSALAAGWIPGLYRNLTSRSARSALRGLVLKLEGGPVYSLTIRQILRENHGLDVGLYTVGPCGVAPGLFAAGTRIGRYSSIYYTVRTLDRDGPSESWPPKEGGPAPDAGTAEGGVRLDIGHDVFIGHNAVVLPGVRSIGTGAIIGAGSVVRADVPPYGIVTGNPGRVVKYRFEKDVIAEMLESRWWLKTIDELRPEADSFQLPLDGDKVRY